MFPAYHPQAEYDPRVASRIAAGEPSRAADYIQLARDRAEIIAEATELIASPNPNPNPNPNPSPSPYPNPNPKPNPHPNPNPNPNPNPYPNLLTP